MKQVRVLVPAAGAGLWLTSCDAPTEECLGFLSDTLPELCNVGGGPQAANTKERSHGCCGAGTAEPEG